MLERIFYTLPWVGMWGSRVFGNGEVWTVARIERRFDGNLRRHDGPERQRRTNIMDSTSFCFVCFYLHTLYSITYIYIYTQYTMYNIYSCFASLLSPHAMFPPCRFCFETNYVKKKGDSSKPSFTIYNFFQFFPCLTTIPFFKLVQSCVKIIWKTFACCTWWIADDRRGSQVRLVSSARLRVCLHWMWPWRRACNLEMMPGNGGVWLQQEGSDFEAEGPQTKYV